MDAEKQIAVAGNVIDQLAGSWMLAAELASEKLGVAFDAAAMMQRMQMHNVVIGMLTRELQQHIDNRDTEGNPILKLVAANGIRMVSVRLAEVLAKTGIERTVADQAVVQMIEAKPAAKRIARDAHGRFAGDELDLATPTNGRHN